MKSILVAALVAPAIAGVSFGEWSAAQKKVFKTREEFAMRRAIFNNNAAIVDAHNTKFAAGQETFSMALNDFADLTNEEFRARYASGRSHGAAATALKTFAPGSVSLPASVNWTAAGAVTPVKNQGQCGSCCEWRLGGPASCGIFVLPPF